MVDVHWIQPYRTDKNIGKAINDAIVQICDLPDAGTHFLQDDDWVVLMDHDILFLQPDTKAHIMDILENTTFDILGCMTNRLGSDMQLVKGMFDVDSISTHIAQAEYRWSAYGATVVATEVVAGMLMCFKVSTWQALGGFDENRINFDWLFCSRAPKKRLRVGIMAGIYIMHLYRWGSKYPANDYKHLEV
ncbi:hypothetical protein [Mucilaginibacter sp.]|jgi:glycosyltransferase involved in cell wall biosynthesis|uniref:hypothetical protein n=1 Tax=Mucilaginibacter sp. TaxID=1882438 RepID=UPI0035648800